MRLTAFLVFPLLFFGTLPTTLAHGKVLYIDQSAGNDENDGRANTPFKTLGQAIQSAAGGKTVLLRNGAYDSIGVKRRQGEHLFEQDYVTIKPDPQWPDYTMRAETHNAYNDKGGGFLLRGNLDTEGYLADLALGKIVLRMLNEDGVIEETDLASGDSMLPRNSEESHLISIRDVAEGVEISVDADQDGMPDLVATDPYRHFSAGRVGVYNSSLNGWHRMNLVSLEIELHDGLSSGNVTEPIPVILDTDIDTDCDDVGAVACLHALANVGEIEILATTISSNYPYCAPCLDAMNQFYGRGELPLGVPKRPGASIKRGSRYAKQIAQQYPSRFANNNEAPSAVKVLRQVLAKADDASVRLVTVGYLTNVADLLRSSPDETSPLSGLELAKRKVSHFVCMGGRYPEHLDPGKYGNFKPDPDSAVYVARHWPGTIYFSGEGEKIGTGRGRHQLPEDHPLRVAYDLYLGDKPTRSSWDQTGLMFAVRPGAAYWKVRVEGGNHIFPNGTNRWVDEDPADHRLVEIAERQRVALGVEIERLMMQALGRSQQ